MLGLKHTTSNYSKQRGPKGPVTEIKLVRPDKSGGAVVKNGPVGQCGRPV